MIVSFDPLDLDAPKYVEAGEEKGIDVKELKEGSFSADTSLTKFGLKR